jgi:hypothetical protein
MRACVRAHILTFARAFPLQDLVKLLAEETGRSRVGQCTHPHPLLLNKALLHCSLDLCYHYNCSHRRRGHPVVVLVVVAMPSSWSPFLTHPPLFCLRSIGNAHLAAAVDAATADDLDDLKEQLAL